MGSEMWIRDSLTIASLTSQSKLESEIRGLKLQVEEQREKLAALQKKLSLIHT